MSLTSQLAQQDSPVSRWFQANMKPGAVHQIVKRINRVLFPLPRLIVDNSDPAHVGRAFDYAFRWEVAPLKANELVAWLGARDGHDQKIVKNLVEIGNKNRDARPRASLVLSWFEQTFRSGERPTALIDAGKLNFIDLMEKVSREDAEDVEMLMLSIPGVWQCRPKGNWIPNPTFDGSSLVGGADADWIIGDTLYDCKVSRKREPFTIAMLLQMAGYVLLDSSDRYGIKNVGWYFARHRCVETMPVTALFKNLLHARMSFESHLLDDTPRGQLVHNYYYDYEGDMDAWF